MSCEDCGDESFIEDDSSVQIDIFDDDSQIIFDVSALEVDICDEDIQLVEVDGGIVYFEEDAQIEVLDFDDVIEIIECVETTGSSGSGAVDSVNGETGVVVLNATDVGADPAGSAATAQANANAYTDTEIGNIDFPVDSVNGQTNVVVLGWADVGADQAGSAAQALIDANAYTDTEIAGVVALIPNVPDGTVVNDILVWNGSEYEAEQLIVDTEPPKTTTLFDETTTPGVIYIGKALPTGAAISEAGAVWSIKTIDATADVEIKWADGVTTYTKVWDNRASYSYY